MIMQIKKFEAGDIVWIMSEADHYANNTQPDQRGVIMGEIGDYWSRIFIASGDTTRLVDLPNHVLKKIEDV